MRYIHDSVAVGREPVARGAKTVRYTALSRTPQCPHGYVGRYMETGLPCDDKNSSRGMFFLFNRTRIQPM